MFADRVDAGRRLAARLQAMTWSDPVVLGLARGGVPVAREVAAALAAPLDVAVARKIGAPGRPELGVGAVTADGPPYYHAGALAELGLTPADLQAESERERAEARRRLRLYRGDRARPAVAGRDVLLVDDGLATGVTARAALGELRAEHPRRLVFAAPVCAPQSAAALRAEGDADEVVCVAAPAVLGAVSRWYRDFTQTLRRRGAGGTARSGASSVGPSGERAAAMSSGHAGRLHVRPHPPARTEPPMTAITAATPTTSTPSRAANVGLWTLQVLLAAVYAFSAFGKLSADPQNVAGFEAMGLGTTGMYLIGSLELAGAIAMFVPRLTGLAALCFVALMTGAVIITWAMMGPSLLVAIPATVGVVAAIVAWGRRDSTRRLVAHLRR